VLQELMAAVTNLPAIAQGALGSGLFALLFRLGQISYRKTTIFSSALNKRKRIAFLNEEIIMLHILSAKNVSDKGALIVPLLYGALKNFARAFILLTLGLIFGSFINVFGMVGYIGALYYFFSALRILRGIDEPIDIDAKISELTTELNRLKE
jgi:hypothetical protein